MSPKSILLTVGAALVAFGEALQNTQDEAGEAAPTGQTGTATSDAPKPRGRPRGSTNAAPPAGGETGVSGPTDAERFEKNRVLIKPLLEGGLGDEVKAIVLKYSPTGLKGVSAADQAAFEKDIAPLSY